MKINPKYFISCLLLTGSISLLADNPEIDTCPCWCWTDEQTEVYDLTNCGELCGESEDEVTFTTTRYYEEDVPTSECVSGKRRFSQEITVTTTKRWTNQEGSYFAEQYRAAPPFSESVDCSGCEPCPDITTVFECGDVKEPCAPQPGDVGQTTEGEPVDLGCVDTTA